MRFLRLSRQAITRMPCSPSCQNEFLDTMRLLGARRGTARHRLTHGVLLEIQPVFVRCPRETWEQVVGDIDNDSCQCIRHCPRALRVWRHQWTGEQVTCVGRLWHESGKTQLVEINCAVFHGSNTQLAVGLRADGRVSVHVLPKRRSRHRSA